MKPRSLRIQSLESYDGPGYANGRIHGSKWKRVWEVVARFESEEEAMSFLTSPTTPDPSPADEAGGSRKGSDSSPSDSSSESER